MSPEELAKIPYITIGGVRGTNPSYVGSDEAPAGLGGDEPVVEEVAPAGDSPVSLQDLNPDDLKELAIGVEAIIEGLSVGSMEQDELDNLIIDLQKKYTPDVLREALDLAMNQ